VVCGLLLQPQVRLNTEAVVKMRLRKFIRESRIKSG
jgi:hypothetical protein